MCRHLLLCEWKQQCVFQRKRCVCVWPCDIPLWSVSAVNPCRGWTWFSLFLCDMQPCRFVFSPLLSPSLSQWLCFQSVFHIVSLALCLYVKEWLRSRSSCSDPWSAASAPWSSPEICSQSRKLSNYGARWIMFLCPPLRQHHSIEALFLLLLFFPYIGQVCQFMRRHASVSCVRFSDSMSSVPASLKETCFSKQQTQSVIHSPSSVFVLYKPITNTFSCLFDATGFGGFCDIMGSHQCFYSQSVIKYESLLTVGKLSPTEGHSGPSRAKQVTWWHLPGQSVT